MCPRSSKQFEDIRQEKRQLIMDVALELFAENGFHATSISQIAKKAKISKGLIYNYFESKNDILEEITRWAFDNIYLQLDPNKDGILTREEFVGFIRATLKSVDENRHFWKLYFALVFQPQILEAYIQKYTDKGIEMGKMLHEFIVLQGSVSPEKDLMAISFLLKGATLVVLASPHFFLTDDIVEDTVDACFRLISNNKNTGCHEKN